MAPDPNPDSLSPWLHTGQHCTNHRGYLAAAGPNTAFGKRAEFDVNIRTRVSWEGRGVFVGVFLNACTECPTLKGSIS